MQGEYKGIKYKKVKTGWELIWPSKLVTFAQAATEEELKQNIDELKAPLQGG